METEFIYESIVSFYLHLEILKCHELCIYSLIYAAYCFWKYLFNFKYVLMDSYFIYFFK